jgi:predicted nucleic acid-binding protein
MIYADTEFFVALVKDNDWLQGRAEAIARDHERDIYTSRATLLELLMISERFEFDRMEALSHALEIASVPEDEGVLFQAADYMEQHDLTAFDAYHVAYAGDDTILSSDRSFDDVTDDRLPIDESRD